MQEKYNVVLSGRNPAADPHVVTQKLASLFKCSIDRAAQLLAQPSCVVKKEVGAETADKYKKAIESTGAQCVIQLIPNEPSLEFDVVPAEPVVKAFNPLPVLTHAVPQETTIPLPAGAPTPQAQSAARNPHLQEAPPPAIRDSKSSASGLPRQEAVEIFVGKNHTYFARKWTEASKKKNQLSWNWAAFLVGFGWMGYRKMYRYSWIFIGVIAAELFAELIFGVPSSITSSINLGIAIGFGLKGNAWYQQHVNAQVDLILASRSADDARKELARVGGTNVRAAIAFVVCLFVLLAMIGLIAEG